MPLERLRMMTSLMLLLLGTDAGAEEPKFELNGDAEKGKPNYKLFCAPCHGDKGLGNGPAAVSLNPKPSSFVEASAAGRLTPEWVYRITRDGGQANGKSPLMVAMSAALTDAQLRDVSAFVLTLAGPTKKTP